MIPQTLIVKLSSHRGAWLNSIELTHWFLNHKTKILPKTNLKMKEMHRDIQQQFSLNSKYVDLYAPGRRCTIHYLTL
ncbi:hypothetical protein AMECASPLE_039688 [Ameca splendens]|uniref:Uncharacterized protein n=1 Tax=Ameca splendens TaxID=208324 RepID=A0ABV0Z6C8_9TELE